MSLIHDLACAVWGHVKGTLEVEETRSAIVRIWTCSRCGHVADAEWSFKSESAKSVESIPRPP